MDPQTIARIPGPTDRLIEKIGAPSPEIDLICSLVGDVFSTSTVVVSLLDEVRQWFRYHSGIVHQDSTEVCWAFCAQTIREERFFEVVDARRDGRYADNILVTQPPHIVYYAGVPLELVDGTRPGALAIIDEAPRAPLSDAQIDMLWRFGRIVSRELDYALRD